MHIFTAFIQPLNENLDFWAQFLLELQSIPFFFQMIDDSLSDKHTICIVDQNENGCDLMRICNLGAVLYKGHFIVFMTSVMWRCV